MDKTRLALIVLVSITAHATFTQQFHESHEVVPTNSEYVAHILGHKHQDQFGKIFLPINLLEIFSLGAMINHSLNLFMEMHIANDSAWDDFPNYEASVMEALSKIERTSNLTGTPVKVFPENDAKASHESSHGTPDQQKQYVINEISLLRGEVESINSQILHVFEKWAYVPVEDENGPEHQDPRELLNTIVSTLDKLNLQQFNDKNQVNKKLGAKEILNNLKDPQFTYKNVTAEQNKTLNELNQLPINSNQKMSLGLKSRGTLQYKEFFGATEVVQRSKRQVALLGLLVGAGLGYAGASWLGGTSLFPNFVSRSDLASVLNDVNQNADQLHILCEDVGNLTHITRDIFARQQTFYQHLTNLDGHLYKNTRKIDFLNSLALVKPLINRYRDATSQVVTAVHNVGLGQFPSSFVKLSHLVAPLKKLYAKSKQRGYQPVTNDARILLASSTRIFVLDFQLIVEIKVPLEKSSLSMPKLVHIPARQKLLINELAYTLHLPANLFQVNLQSKIINTLTESSLSNCKIYDKQYKFHQNSSELKKTSENFQVYICPQISKIKATTSTIYSHHTRLSKCIFSLLLRDNLATLKSCKITVTPLMSETAIQLPRNYFSISAVKNYKKTMYCSRLDIFTNKVKLRQSGTYFDKDLIIQIPENCFLESRNFLLIPELTPSAITANPVVSQFSDNQIFEFINSYANNRFQNSFHLRETLRNLSIKANMSAMAMDIQNLNKIEDDLPTKLHFNLPDHPIMKSIRKVFVSLMLLMVSSFFMYYVVTRFPGLARDIRNRLWASRSGQALARRLFKSQPVATTETKSESQPSPTEPRSEIQSQTEENRPTGDGGATGDEFVKSQDFNQLIERVEVLERRFKHLQTRFNMSGVEKTP